jgi:hypothetical protein
MIFTECRRRVRKIDFPLFFGGAERQKSQFFGSDECFGIIYDMSASGRLRDGFGK